MTPQQTILAIAISQPNKASDILCQLNNDHFDIGINSRLFQAIQDLVKEEIEPNLITIGSVAVNKAICLKEDIKHLLAWQSALTYNENITDLVDLIKDDLIKIKIQKQAHQVGISLADGNDGLSTALDTINAFRQIVENEIDVSKILKPAQMMDNETQAYEKRAMLVQSGKATGVDSGLRIVNQFTGGWQNGELIIMAARPSMGKTALALFHMVEAAKRSVPTMFFNLEMNESQLSQRLIVNQTNAKINPQALKLGKLTQSELHDFIRAKGEIERLPFTIYDKGGVSISELVRAIKTANSRQECDFAIVDYLQLIQGDDTRGKNREQEIAYISRTLKQTAKELNIPILALAQLSRAVEQRGGEKKPILSDLRESGSIEQDADAVLFVWRPKYYSLNDETGKPYENEMFYLFEKNRTGAVGEAKFLTNYCISNFYDEQNDFPSHLPYEDKKEAMKPLMNFDEQLDF